MVMSIISAFFVWALFFTAIAGLIHDNECDDDYYYYNEYRGRYYYDDDCGVSNISTIPYDCFLFQNDGVVDTDT